MKRNYSAPKIECLLLRPLRIMANYSAQTEEDINFDPLQDNGEWA